MYPEFIVIYVGLGILLAMVAVLLVLVIKLLKGGSGNQMVSRKAYMGGGTVSGTVIQSGAPAAGPMAFCRNCATQFDAKMPSCPRCGTPR